jgi:hypothetical protein
MRYAGKRGPAAFKRALAGQGRRRPALITEYRFDRDPATGQWKTVNFQVMFPDGTILEYEVPYRDEYYDLIDAEGIDFIGYGEIAVGGTAGAAPPR